MDDEHTEKKKSVRLQNYLFKDDVAMEDARCTHTQEVMKARHDISCVRVGWCQSGCQVRGARV